MSRRITEIKPKRIVRRWTKSILPNVCKEGKSFDIIVDFTPLIILNGLIMLSSGRELFNFTDADNSPLIYFD